MKVSYHLSLRLARIRRFLYSKNLRRHAASGPRNRAQLPFRVLSFSGMRDLPEQVASWRSFLAFLGQPEEFLLVSDGSHDGEAKEVLRAIDTRVRIVHWKEYLRPEFPECLHRYAQEHPLGKKLSVFMNLSSLTPALYMDSDILFFPGIDHFRSYWASGEPGILYLPDCAASFDFNLLRDGSEQSNPVNSGFLYFSKGISLEKGLSRFQSPDHPKSFFSEQTIVHLGIHDAGGQPLPPERYIMRAEDQFSPGDAYADGNIAMRHYISSIRYKMWRQVKVS